MVGTIPLNLHGAAGVVALIAWPIIYVTEYGTELSHSTAGIEHKTLGIECSTH